MLSEMGSKWWAACAWILAPWFPQSPAKTLVQRAPDPREVSFLFLRTTAGSADSVGGCKALNKSHPTYQHVQRLVPTQAPTTANVWPHYSEKCTSVTKPQRVLPLNNSSQELLFQLSGSNQIGGVALATPQNTNYKLHICSPAGTTLP